MLARVADAQLLVAFSLPGRVMLLAMVVVQTATGVWVRGHVTASWVLVTACLTVTAVGLALPRLAARRAEPRWADAARTHARSLEGRVPLVCLDIAARHARVAGERAGREAFLYVPRCGHPARPHLGVCHLAGVLPMNGRLLLVIGEHLAACPPHLVTGALGHAVRHLTGWRLPATYLRTLVSVAGPFLIGWAVPWPVVPVAVAGFLAVMTLASWVTEVSCDLGAARAGGVGGILAAAEYLHEVTTADRAADPAWKRYASSVLKWVTGPTYPPLPLRLALITALTRHVGDPGAGWVA